MLYPRSKKNKPDRFLQKVSRDDVLMAVSSLLAITFFLVANYVSNESEFKVLFGSLQILLNTFVLVTWWIGFKASRGLKRFIAFWGVVVPIGFASVTLYRVIVPSLF